MAAYAAGSTVERSYAGPNADTVREAAQPQIAAFLAAGFTIASERWAEDSTSGGTPVGDAVAAGTISYLAGRGGTLVITYLATGPAELPIDMPAYTLQDPRVQNLHTWSQFQVAVSAVFLIVFALVFLMIVSQMMSATSRFGP